MSKYMKSQNIWESSKEVLVNPLSLLVCKNPVYQRVLKYPSEPAPEFTNYDLAYLKYDNTEKKIYIPSIIHEDDIEEIVTNKWIPNSLAGITSLVCSYK